MDKQRLSTLILQTCGQVKVESNDVLSASHILTDFQVSAEAWKLSMELLTGALNDLHNECSIHLATFAAMTLKNKIKSDSFDRLSNEDKLAMKDLLVQCLSGFSTVRVVRTQICLCLVYCILKKPDWSDLLNFILSLINNDSRLSTVSKNDASLDVLTLMAEEITGYGARTLKLGKHRREEVRDQLRCIEKHVMKTLSDIMLTDGSILETGLRCFTGWCEARLFSETSLMESPVLSDIIFGIISGLREVQDVDHIDICGDAMTTLFDMVSDDLGKYRSLLIKLNRIIVGTDFKNHFIKLIVSVNNVYGPTCECDEESCNSDFTEMLDLRRMDNMCRAYTELCRALVNVYRLGIPDDELNDTAVLSILLEICPRSNYKIANLIMSAWTYLADNLSIASSPGIRKKFRSYFQSIVPVTIDVSTLGRFTLHRQTSLRRSALDLFELLVENLGGRQVGEMLCETLRQSMDNLEKSEAIVFLLQSCPPVNEDMNAVVESIVKTPRETLSQDFVLSSVEFLGSLGFFLKNRTEHLPHVMEFLFAALRTKTATGYDGHGGAAPKWSTVASKALLHVCTCCSSELVGSIGHFIDASVAAAVECQQQIVVINLIKCSSMLLVHLRGQELQEGLNRLTGILYQDLVQTSQDDVHLVRKLMHKLDRICSVYRTIFQAKSVNAQLDMQVRSALVETLRSILPYTLSARVLCANEDVVESACNLVRYGIRSVGDMYLSLLEGTVDSILQTAEVSSSMPSCLLYLASVIVDEFSSVEQSKSSVLKLTINSPLIARTIARLRDGTDAFRRNPDLVDDFFRLCKRLTEHYTVEFVSSEQFDQCLSLGIESLNNERELKEGTSSLIAFIHCVVDLMTHEGQLAVQLRLYITSKGLIPPLITALVRSACFELCSDSRERVGVILYRLKGIDEAFYKQCIDDVFLNHLEKQRGDLVILTQDQINTYAHKIKTANSSDIVASVFDSISELAR